MHRYETLLKDSFPVFAPLFGRIEELCPLEKTRRRAVRFLEMNCSAVWGFPTEARVVSDPNARPVEHIPQIFESGLLLPLIKNEGISPLVTSCLVAQIKRDREQNGFWNCFYREKEVDVNYFPDDIDDTSIMGMALYTSGELTMDDCVAVGKNMLNSALFDRDGGLTCWMLNKDETRKIGHEKYLSKPYMCPGCISNCLWLFGTVGLDTDPRMKPSLDFLDKFIDTLNEYVDSEEEIPGMIYYTNKFVNYFFIARYLAASEYARERFLARVASIVMRHLETMAEEDRLDRWSALDMACVVLAAITLKLHLDEWDVKMTGADYSARNVGNRIRRLTELLIGMQDEDGSYPPAILYRWNRIGHYAGSRVCTTAFVLGAIGAANRGGLGSSDGANPVNGCVHVNGSTP